MAWPPILPNGTRDDLTPQLTNHPQDQNRTSAALGEIVGRMDVQYLATRFGLPELSTNTGVDYPFSPGVVTVDSGDIARGTTNVFQPRLNQPVWCMLAAGIRWSISANGTRRISIAVNGTTIVESHDPGFSGGFTSQNVTVLHRLKPGDEFQLIGWQNAGGLTVMGGAQTFLAVAGLG